MARGKKVSPEKYLVGEPVRKNAGCSAARHAIGIAEGTPRVTKVADRPALCASVRVLSRILIRVRSAPWRGSVDAREELLLLQRMRRPKAHT